MKKMSPRLNLTNKYKHWIDWIILFSWEIWTLNLILSLKEEYLSEDEEAADSKADNVAAKPFFSTVDGVSFHANSFMELNLSRPLLRACETLGYKKPTPIQVQYWVFSFSYY